MRRRPLFGDSPPDGEFVDVGPAGVSAGPRVEVFRGEADLAHLEGRVTDAVREAVREEFRLTEQKTFLDTVEQTVFGFRRRHWRAEKDFLAREFVYWAFDRLLAAGDGIANVTIVLDSGSTLLPVFRELARVLGDLANTKKQSDVGSLQMLTNNLAGTLLFQEEAVTHRASRFAETFSMLRLLPGRVIPEYSAVVDEGTVECLRKERAHAPNRRYIGFLTGNWIWLDPETQSPVPLVRSDIHREVKKAILDLCDDSYVITPLGKIFAANEWRDVKAALAGIAEQPFGDDRQQYERVDPSSVRSATLVTTSRPPGLLLSRLSQRLGEIVPADRLLQFEFDRLPSDPNNQLEVEFPHAPTRSLDIRRRFFFAAEHETEVEGSREQVDTSTRVTEASETREVH